MKLSKLLLSCLLFMGLSFTTGITACADTPCVHIEVQYSADITPKAGDEFCITYGLASDQSAKDATITLDASKLSGGRGKLDMNVGDYEIIDIEYLGNNEVIKDQGYAINKAFSVNAEDNTDTVIRIAIGASAGNSLLKKEENAFAKNSEGAQVEELEAATTEESTEEKDRPEPNTVATSEMPTTSSEVLTTETVTGEDRTTINTTEPQNTEVGSYENNPDILGEMNTTELTNSTEEETVSADELEGKKVTQSKHSSTAGRLIPIVIIGIIGAIIILILKKKGIL